MSDSRRRRKGEGGGRNGGRKEEGGGGGGGGLAGRDGEREAGGRGWEETSLYIPVQSRRVGVWELG